MSAVRSAAVLLPAAAGTAMVAAGPLMALKGARGRPRARAFGEVIGRNVLAAGTVLATSG
ncbi:hypothetical protein HCN51_33335 [Nonomuraea sp. FMUSA5-5]|uniref:LysE family translocator n=1 Tax=Nonomuraea composti TaxID=2720023 RepID=A0ABX1BG25_9ACTN|nr:hypothetical protein [Nonomuraea sp. FMUSA5-5]NJP94266.1 hypothetical protein [Nonomuraea sp. FMUSA5-5]